jgi:hypothetical protein
VGPEPNTALSVPFLERLKGTYDIKHIEEKRRRVRKVRKMEESWRSDANILKSIRGVVSNADWYATSNQVKWHSTHDRTGVPWNRMKSLWVSMTRRPNAILGLALSNNHKKRRSSAHQ